MEYGIARSRCYTYVYLFALEKERSTIPIIFCYYIDHEEHGQQSIGDGKLEVVALYSSFHMAQLQVGLSQPYRLGQASNIKVCIWNWILM